MISSGKNDQQERQLINKVIQYEGHLNTVFEKEPLIFSEITKVFNILEAQNVNESLHKLKERLIQICLQEKEEYLDYLYLPKFRQVSQHALELLKTALQEISERIKIEQENSKFNDLVSGIERYIPKVSSISEMENYHMSIFELYCKSSICPIGAMQRDIDSKNSEKNLFDGIKPQWNFQNSPYSNFVKSNSHAADLNKYEHWSNQMNRNGQQSGVGIYESDNMFYSPQKVDHGHQKLLLSQNLLQQNLSNPSNLLINPSSSSLKQTTPHIPISSSHMIQENSQNSFIKRQKQQENSRMIEDYSQPLSNVSEHRHKTFNVVDPNFKNCVCKGKIQKVGQQEFFCDYCNCKFHAQCLRIQREIQGSKKCPICVAEEVQNDCFQLIKPALLSSWAVYSKQNPTPAVIKFTEPLLMEMKRIVSKPEHKIYLKLITIRKNLRSLSQQNQKNKKFDDIKTKSKQEIGSYEVMNEQGSEDYDEIEKDDSEMIDEENQIKGNERKDKNNVAKQINNPISLPHQSKTSIQLTANYVSQMLKNPSPVLSLNFGFSPKYLNAQQSFEEQRVIYYGIYEVKKKKLPEILYKMTCESRGETEVEFDVEKIRNLITDINFLCQDQEKSAICEETQKKVLDSPDCAKTIKLKLLISKRQLRQVYESSEQQNKQIFPIRFTNCKSLDHVFELQNYLQTLYNFNLNCKTQQHYNLKRLSPDTALTHCPLCIQKSFLAEENKNQSQTFQGQQHFYLDTKLHELMNDHKILEAMVKMYDDANSGQEYDFVDVLVEMKFWRDLCQGHTEIGYSYALTKIQTEKPQIEEENPDKISQGQDQNLSQKESSESMEAEDYLNNKQQQIHAQNQEKLQVHQHQEIMIANEQFSKQTIRIEPNQIIQKQIINQIASEQQLQKQVDSERKNHIFCSEKEEKGI